MRAESRIGKAALMRFSNCGFAMMERHERCFDRRYMTGGSVLQDTHA